MREAINVNADEQKKPALTKNILVIDDDPDITNLIARALSDGKYSVTIMDQSELAYGPANEIKTCDIAVIDMFMPDIGGIEGIKKIRRENASCKVIAISGGWGCMDSSEALSAAEKIGADMVLSKPFRINEVRETVCKMLDS
ncbi:MAG: response regulator [Gammaproteobacteria bacterium]|nr:response regulator [Gammaproteobacteria bacterium]